MRRKVIAGTVIFALTFLVVSLVAAAEDLGKVRILERSIKTGLGTT
jgi:hypothetical protein